MVERGVRASASSRKMAARARSPWTWDQACAWCCWIPSGGCTSTRSRSIRPRRVPPIRRKRCSGRCAMRCEGRPAGTSSWRAITRWRPAGRTAATSPWWITCSRCATSGSGCGCRLPIIGSAYPLARQNGISAQDLSSGAYRHLRDSLESVFRDAPPLAFLAGHDHGLQVLSGGGVRHVLVSGSGSYDHNNAVRRLDSTRYASATPGFMRVDSSRAGASISACSPSTRTAARRKPLPCGSTDSAGRAARRLSLALAVPLCANSSREPESALARRLLLARP